MIELLVNMFIYRSHKKINKDIYSRQLIAILYLGVYGYIMYSIPRDTTVTFNVLVKHHVLEVSSVNLRLPS